MSKIVVNILYKINLENEQDSKLLLEFACISKHNVHSTSNSTSVTNTVALMGLTFYSQLEGCQQLHL